MAVPVPPRGYTRVWNTQERKTYTSIPSGDQVKDAKLIDDQGQFAEGWSQFVEDQSQLTVN